MIRSPVLGNVTITVITKQICITEVEVLGVMFYDKLAFFE